MSSLDFNIKYFPIRWGLHGVAVRVLSFNQFESWPGLFILESWELLADAWWFTVQNLDQLVCTCSPIRRSMTLAVERDVKINVHLCY